MDAVEFPKAYQKEENMQKNELPKLRNCPFCGGKARYIYREPFNLVRCERCKALGGLAVDSYEQQDGKKESIELWNRRTEK